THCCPQNYQLAPAENRFVSVIEQRGWKYADQWITKRGSAQFINIVRAAQLMGITGLHDCDFLTKYDRMDKPDERSRRHFFKIKYGDPRATHHMPDKFECSSWYWVRHLLPDLTTITPEDRKYTWMQKNTAIFGI
uniref:PAPS_reduct domain-containing protein n=1 Tax=Globodera pallida TaxID=36090 RepID=A0A183CQ29_GLOPA